MQTTIRAAVAASTIVAITMLSGCSGTQTQQPSATGQQDTTTSQTQYGNGNGSGNGNSNGGGQNAGQGAHTSAVQVTGPLTAEEAELVTFMREEERLAGDLYTAFDEKYDRKVFTNISASEATHFETMGAVIAQAGLTDPSAGSTPGVYADPELQQAYDAWLAQGSESLSGALQAAVDLEKKDIADLQQAIDASTNGALDQVLQNLLTASQNHLDAFSQQLSDQ